MPRTSIRADLTVLGIGTAGFAGGSFLPWLSNRACKGGAISLWTLTTSRWVALGLLVVVLGANAAGAWSKGNQDLPRGIGTLASLVLLLAPLIGIVIVELLALWAYPQFLPPTWRRFLPGAVPLGGLWISTIGAGLLVVASSGGAPGLADRVAGVGAGLRRGQTSALGIVLVLAAIPVVLAGRTFTWLAASSPAGSWAVPGYAMPWVGVVTLLLLLVLVGISARAVFQVGPWLAAGLVVVGWSFTLVAAIVIVSTVGTPSYHLPPWLTSQISLWSSRLQALIGDSCQLPLLSAEQAFSSHVAAGPLMILGAGIAVASGGMLALRDMKEPRP